MQYQEGTYTTIIDLLNKFRTFITGIGWTELQYITDKFLAIKSNGEDGSEEDIISAISVDSETGGKNILSYITFVDKDTYTGRIQRNFWVTATDSPYWFFADLDHFVIVAKYPGYLYIIHYAGLLKRYYAKAEWTRPFFIMGGPVNANYYHTGLVWASNIKSNLRHPTIDSAQPNARNGSYILVPVTIYDKTNKLMPGELIGMYHIAKEGAEDEGTITIDGVEYKTFKQYDYWNDIYYPFAFLKS